MSVKVDCFAVKDEFISHGSVDNQFEVNNITYENILENVIKKER